MSQRTKRLRALADRIKDLNIIMDEVFYIMDEKCEKGHVGEFIASEIFDIQLFSSKTVPRADGYFRSGPLADRTVNIKFYPKQEGILDLPNSPPKPPPPDYYLVLTGPRGKAGKKGPRPWVIDAVYLFDAVGIVANLFRRGLRVGTGASVKNELWMSAEIHPKQRCTLLILTASQRKMLRLFKSP